MTPEEIMYQRVNSMSLGELLHEHRFLPAGDPRLQGKEGEYRGERMAELRRQNEAAWVATSKMVGW